MLYKIFVDDSGTRDYHSPYSREFIDSPPDTNEYKDFWRKNYFVLCGIRINVEHVAEINSQINNIKDEFFGTRKVEIKSDWLRNPIKCKKKYINIYGITQEKLIALTEKIYELISWNCDKLKIIAVVYDKRFYGEEKRNSHEGDPLIKSVQVLLERIQYTNNPSIVVFDQFESQLKVTKGEHQEILKLASGKIKMQKDFVNEFINIKDIKFVKSSGENFIQIADLCAYNIYRQFVDYGRDWQGENENKTMPMYKYFEKIKCNFLYHPNTMKVCGVGLTCIPDVGKVNWDLLQGCKKI